MKLKKLTALLLSAAMTIGLLAGCGNKTSQPSGGSNAGQPSGGSSSAGQPSGGDSGDSSLKGKRVRVVIGSTSTGGDSYMIADMVTRYLGEEMGFNGKVDPVGNAAALDAMCARLLDELGPLPVVFSGGVAGNSILRQRLEARFGACFAEPAFSADNGVGAAVLAWGSFAARS